MHPNQISNWKKRFIEGAEYVFSDKMKKTVEGGNEAELRRQIYKLKAELGRLRNKLGFDVNKSRKPARPDANESE